MIAAILFLAVQRGFDTVQLVGVAVTIVWALLLPVILTWTWRSTWGRPSWLRLTLTATVAIALLVAFAFGIRPLLA